jgi:hypothetical protein
MHERYFLSRIYFWHPGKELRMSFSAMSHGGVHDGGRGKSHQSPDHYIPTYIRGLKSDMDECPAPTIVLNGRVFDTAAEMLRDASGKEITLRAQSFAVLKYLALNADRTSARTYFTSLVLIATANCSSPQDQASGTGQHF